MRIHLLPIFLSCLAILASHIHAAEVPLHIRNHTDVKQTNAPVRGGVPFPLGVLQTCNQARLLDATGAEIPCQIRPIAHWYDGSIKWLLVDTRMSLPASGDVSVRLQPGSATTSRYPVLSVSQNAQDLTVDTGPARFLFSKTAFGLPTTIWADLNGDGKWDTQVADGGSEFAAEIEHQPPGEPQEENWLRDSTGGTPERFSAGPLGDYHVEIENQNPLHAVVKLRGYLSNQSGRRVLQYVIRAHAYAGSPELRIVHSFIYMGRPKQDFIRAIWLQFPQSTYNSYAFGGSQAHQGALASGDDLSLTEIGPAKIYHLAPYTTDKAVKYTLTNRGNTIAHGDEAAGWVRLAGPQSAMQFAMRNFWKLHPKELRCDQRGLRVYLWPTSGNKVLDLRRRYDYIENKYHYDLTLWPYGGEGVGVTHEMALRFGPPQENAAAQMAALLDAPPLLECSPQYYATSGAFGPFAVANPARYPHFEGLQTVDLEWLRHNQRAFHWDGMIDYGDNLFHGYETISHYGYVAPKSWCSRGYVGWQCNDGTLTQSLFLQYLRTGDYEAFRTAEALCRHVTEIDTCHYCAEEPKQVGGGHRHDQQHWGNGVRGYGTATHGAIDYYLLTGDERTLDVMKEYTRYHFDGEPSEDEDRIGGLIRMWEINQDPTLKKRADELLAQELAVAPKAAWPFVTTAHFRFVSNTSVSLLYYLYSTSPQDHAQLKQAIIKAADSLEPAATSTWEEVPYLPTLIAALAYQQTAEPRYASLLACLLQRLSIPRDTAVPADFTAHLRKLDFESMVTTAKQWNVNNLYTATIHDLVPLPYAIAALQKANMNEAAIWAVSRTTQIPASFEEVIPTPSIAPEINHCFIATVTHGAPSDIAGGHSDLVLLEDGKPLGPPHSAHADIRKDGAGRFSHWGSRTVYFSASDNTDPRTNGRQYKVVHKGPGN